MTEETTSEKALTIANGELEPTKPAALPVRDAATHETALIVDQFGAYVSKHSERLRVSVKRETVAEAPLLFLEQLLVSGRGISVSSDAIEACCERGIPVYFLSGRGEPYAALYAAGLGGTVLTRRAQLMAYGDGRGVAVACAMAAGKINNQANLLRYMAKYRKATDPSLYQELRLGAGEVRDHLEELRALLGRVAESTIAIDDLRGQLLSIEGRAAQKYWHAVKAIVPVTLGWPGREGRGAKDPLNAALNYGYGVLYGQVERALVLAGLDPYAGFIHVDRPGKPSLTLDLIEEFRAPVVDRAIFGTVNRGTALAQDEEGMLILEVRRAIAERVLERIEESTEPYEGKRQRLRFILQSQARHLAAYLRGERPAYTPFLSRW
ncbi:MAG TPA: CRISPR-associated endonuclease Cas1 [Chloroflexota bacterium]|nr:CRISPR-associated endonuclease Cas1 [Chloroflexota bacterium]